MITFIFMLVFGGFIVSALACLVYTPEVYVELLGALFRLFCETSSPFFWMLTFPMIVALIVYMIIVLVYRAMPRPTSDGSKRRYI